MDNNEAVMLQNKADDIRALARGAGTDRGTGGMVTKLNAASIIMESGADMIIANGADPELLYDIVEGRPVGTLFAGRQAARKNTAQAGKNPAEPGKIPEK